MRRKMNSNHYEISFWLKISLWCSVSSLLGFILIKAKWNSNRCGFHIGNFGRNDISNRYEIFMWIKIYPNLLTPRIELFHLHNSLNISFNAHARLKVIAVIWTEKKSFRVINYHVNTTQNEMPKHFHQNIRSFWSKSEMKRHVNRTCFYVGLKSHTSLISFFISHERTLNPSTKHFRFVHHLSLVSTRR